MHLNVVLSGWDKVHFPKGQDRTVRESQVRLVSYRRVARLDSMVSVSELLVNFVMSRKSVRYWYTLPKREAVS